MPKSPEEFAKYEDMLSQLANEYPELEEEAMALNQKLIDMEPGEGEEDEEMLPEEDIDIDIELGDEEDEELPPL